MLTIGTRVILKPFEDNPEERGKVLSYDPPSDTYVVRVDPRFRTDPRDDGLREIPADQVF